MYLPSELSCTFVIGKQRPDQMLRRAAQTAIAHASEADCSLTYFTTSATRCRPAGVKRSHCHHFCGAVQLHLCRSCGIWTGEIGESGAVVSIVYTQSFVPKVLIPCRIGMGLESEGKVNMRVTTLEEGMAYCAASPSDLEFGYPLSRAYSVRGTKQDVSNPPLARDCYGG